MKNSFKSCISVSLLLLPFFFFSIGAAAQDRTDWLGPSAGPVLRPRLRDKAQNARQHIAAVEVEVKNVFLNDPDIFAQAGVQVAVLEYEVDHCPMIVTTETRIRFRKLTPGITVALLGIDNRLLAPRAKLKVRIP